MRLLANCDAALVALLANCDTQPMTVEMTPESHDATLPGKADRNPAIPEMNREPAFTAFAAMLATMR